MAGSSSAAAAPSGGGAGAGDPPRIWDLRQLLAGLFAGSFSASATPQLARRDAPPPPLAASASVVISVLVIHLVLVKPSSLYSIRTRIPSILRTVPVPWLPIQSLKCTVSPMARFILLALECSCQLTRRSV